MSFPFNISLSMSDGRNSPTNVTLYKSIGHIRDFRRQWLKDHPDHADRRMGPVGSWLTDLALHIFETEYQSKGYKLKSFEVVAKSGRIS